MINRRDSLSHSRGRDHTFMVFLKELQTRTRNRWSFMSVYWKRQRIFVGVSRLDLWPKKVLQGISCIGTFRRGTKKRSDWIQSPNDTWIRTLWEYSRFIIQELQHILTFVSLKRSRELLGTKFELVCVQVGDIRATSVVYCSTLVVLHRYTRTYVRTLTAGKTHPCKSNQR